MESELAYHEKVNILLVDDRPDNLVSLSAAIVHPDYMITTAESGTEALVQLLKRDFAVVVLDVQMPEMDGFQVATLIRQRERSQRTPIIFLTAAYRDTQHVAHGYSLGAVDYILKPFMPEVLEAKVAAFVDLYLMRRRLEAKLAETRELNEELEELNAQLARANKRLNEVDRFRANFLARMSHELRTPLNGIIGFSEFLLDGKAGPLQPKQREYLGDVLNSGRHLLQLINDVLDLSKVEAGKMKLAPETFPLRQAIDEVCSVLTPMVLEKSLTIQKKISPQVHNVRLDQQKFKQVLYNLLSNAVKFTDSHGQVEVSVIPHQGAGIQLQVKDTGIGIKAEDFDKLFVEFQQLDNAGNRPYQGTGLGLALTKKLIELQQGTVRVESDMGKGSTFTVVLPLCQEGGKD
jgi:signal transduction histidine kinase